MNETLAVAALSLVGTLIGSLGGILASNRLTNYRIEHLEKKVQAHNNLIARTYDLEAHSALLDEEIKVANHRIADLEEAQSRKDGKNEKEFFAVD